MEPPQIAARVVGLAQDGSFTAVEELFTADLRAVVSADTLRVAWDAETGNTGPITAVGAPATEPGRNGLVRVSVPVTGTTGGFTVVMSIDQAGRLAGLRLAPAAATAWSPPPYARPDHFSEHEVEVGTGPLAVPGTITMPHRPVPRPGVVLLPGGGPFDRDMTTGPNKPLKDLAWGLAARGIATLRFDKVTFTHPEVAVAPDFTLAKEYVPHAVAAVELLAARHGVADGNVFVLGQSAGGKAAPRVAAAQPRVAGIIVMAGDAAPMPASAVRVARYLATVDAGPAADAAVALVTRQASLAAGPDLSPATPASELPSGLPASYWLDLRDYDPVETAARLKRPVFILQGGRDYQVTVADDLVRWQAGLTYRLDARIRVYDADDHLFFPGAGPSVPADYAAPQHVDPAVVADIAGWVRPRSRLAGALDVMRRRAR